MSNEELKRVESIGTISTYSDGVNGVITKLAYQELRVYMKGKILELGPAEGVMTQEIVKDGYEPDLVEGSESLVIELKRKFPKLDIQHCLFEDFIPKVTYDMIIMGHVLEHVIDPVNILNKYKKHLTDQGFIWASVPNANSIHRQAAVHMGILPETTALNEADIRHGHRRVFTPEAFRKIFELAGMEILNFGGYWLKPLSNAQIESSWTPEMVEAFCKIGREYPNIAGEIYIVAKVAR
jgi:2-polyprenyl-3-methyl-5-hydroxy-6-metoxy-1,4-benzoquinol methylase